MAAAFSISGLTSPMVTAGQCSRGVRPYRGASWMASTTRCCAPAARRPLRTARRCCVAGQPSRSGRYNGLSYTGGSCLKSPHPRTTIRGGACPWWEPRLPPSSSPRASPGKGGTWTCATHGRGQVVRTYVRPPRARRVFTMAEIRSRSRHLKFCIECRSKFSPLNEMPQIGLTMIFKTLYMENKNFGGVKRGGSVSWGPVGTIWTRHPKICRARFFFIRP